jgi:glutaconate CoA-transferase, subunit A
VLGSRSSNTLRKEDSELKRQPLTLSHLARLLQPGMCIAVPADYAGVAMSLTWEILRIGVRDLHLVTVPTSGLQADVLIGAGCVASIETSAVTLGEAGGAPCFVRAIKSGAIRVLDTTCPAIHSGLIAAQRGSPFSAMRGLIGTDILRFRPDWRVLDNPFSETPDPLVLIPAIKPDVALFHAPMADHSGNVWIGRRRELAPMVYASKMTLVTVERIIDSDLLATEELAAGTLPSLYITQVAVAPRGAWPYGMWGAYPTETAELLRYSKLARTQDGFETYVAQMNAKVVA